MTATIASTRDAPAGRPARAGLITGLLTSVAGPALAALPDQPTSLHPWLNATGLSLVFVGLVVFAATTSILYIGERSRWNRRERDLAGELESARGHAERLVAMVGADPQVVISWSGRGGQPVFEGESGFLGASGKGLALAYGTWAPPAEAKKLELATDALKERGESFAFTVAAKNHRFVDAVGRPIGGRAVIRLREVTGERAQLMQIEAALAHRTRDHAALAGLVSALPHPVWIRDGEGRLTWVNAAYARAVETGGGEEAVDKALELLDRDEREASAAARLAQRPFATRAPGIVAGARVTLDILETPTPSGFAGIATDMSELEAVRSDLQRQMDAHVRTLDRLKTAVAVFDGSQHLVYRNAGYDALWGLDPGFLEAGPSDGEILDRLRAERRLPELGDYKAWKSAVQATYTSLRETEDWWYLPGGRTLHVVSNPNPRGGVTYIFDDVTERFTLESRFIALTRTQRETLEAMGEGVAVFGSDGRLKLSNPAFRESWRLSDDFADSLPHIDAVVAKALPLFPDEEIWTEIRGAVASGRDARENYATRMARRDGTVLECAAVPLPEGATLITFADVTASANEERLLTEQNEALEQAAQLRDHFVHHVSYELRSPLTNIIGFAELLGAETVGPLNEKQRDYTGHILRSSGALLAIINDILDLASIDKNELALDLAEIDVAATIAAAATGLQDRISAKAIVLAVEIAPGTGPLRADGKRLRQVLFNLLSNAVGFSSAGQTVRVEVSREGEEIRLTVADEGRGIPPETRAKVFDRFESHSLGSSHRGVGLGLSIVRSLVELHGGRVELDSEPGRGTRVGVIFPAQGLRMIDAAE